MKLNSEYQNLIFIVDDDEDDRSFIQSSLEKSVKNCSLRIFNSGSSLIKALPGSDVPAFILLDLNMPVLNGNETLKLIKKDAVFTQVPVVILTTTDHPLEKQMCLKNGAADFISKPSSISGYDHIAKKLKKLYLDSSEFNNPPFQHYRH